MLPRAAVPVVEPDDELIDAAAELTESEVNRALVVEDGDELVGLLSATDVNRAFEVRRRLAQTS
jgi:CBS domain-containing protein